MQAYAVCRLQGVTKMLIAIFTTAARARSYATSNLQEDWHVEPVKVEVIR